MLVRKENKIIRRVGRSEGKQLDLFSYNSNKISSDLKDYSNWKLSLSPEEDDISFDEVECTPKGARRLFNKVAQSYLNEYGDIYGYDEVNNTVNIGFTLTSPQGKSKSCILVYDLTYSKNEWSDSDSWSWDYEDSEESSNLGYQARIDLNLDNCKDSGEYDDFNKEQSKILFGILKTLADQYGKYLHYEVESPF